MRRGEELGGEVGEVEGEVEVGKDGEAVEEESSYQFQSSLAPSSTLAGPAAGERRERRAR